MAKFVLGGRPSKTALTRAKVGTVVVAVAAFLGSLAGVANSNPAAVSASAVTAETQSADTTAASVTAATDESSSAASTSAQQAMVLPTVRTRGS